MVRVSASLIPLGSLDGVRCINATPDGVPCEGATRARKGGADDCRVHGGVREHVQDSSQAGGVPEEARTTREGPNPIVGCHLLGLEGESEDLKAAVPTAHAIRDAMGGASTMHRIVDPRGESECLICSGAMQGDGVAAPCGERGQLGKADADRTRGLLCAAAPTGTLAPLASVPGTPGLPTEAS